jgi:RNA polymerase sigma-70 factor (ECF subfamily)
MADEPQTQQLRDWLARLRAGDPTAPDELLRHVSDRLQRLTRHMLRGHPAVRRWAQTDDVMQGALLRLLRAVREVHPDSMREFFALAAQQIRRELIDLARHYCGPQGAATHHNTPDPDDPAGLRDWPADAGEAGSLDEWSAFHQKIEELPDEERDVVDLLYYQGLPQAEAAEVLNVTVRTVQRRWHAALVRLHDSLHGSRPGS